MKFTTYLFCLMAIIFGINLFTQTKNESNEVILEDTPIIIEEIKKRGELLVLHSFIDGSKKLENNGFLMNDYAVQLVSDKCSYLIDLNEIKFQQDDGSKVLTVVLPNPIVKCYNQKSWFMSTNEKFWRKELTSNKMNQIIKQIQNDNKAFFDTEINRTTAKKHGEDFIKSFLSNIGYTVKIIWTP